MNPYSYMRIVLVICVFSASLSESSLLGQESVAVPRYQQYMQQNVESEAIQSYAPPVQAYQPVEYPSTQVQSIYPSYTPTAPSSGPLYSTAQAIPTVPNDSAPNDSAAVTPASHPVLVPPVAEVSESAETPVGSHAEEEVTAAVDETELVDIANWYEPGYWFPKKIWSGGAEIGLSGSEGNAQSFSMRGGLNAKRETDRWINAIDLIYNRANSNGMATAHNSLLTINNDLKLGDSLWTMFGNLLFEYDEFRAFDLRVAVNGGIGYQFVKTDRASLIGRLGSGASQEIGAVDDAWVPEAVFGMEYEHQITKRQKISLKIDYFPEWTQYENYRMLTDASWEMLLHEASNMSLKISAIDRYDSTPAGARPNDIDYALLLLWKL